MKRVCKVSPYKVSAALWLLSLAAAAPQCAAQSALNLQQAVDKALASRAGLRAEAERISIAQGIERQSRLIENPTFQFENQNLRPGQTYSVDVDTYAFLTQPLDILGKRKQRIAVASQAVGASQAQYELSRRELVESVKRAYWQARGAQEVRAVLKATAENFQQIIDYHTAQFRTGAISEQDLLRVQLEGERLQIDANLAAIEATKTRVQLQREMGQSDFPDLVLSEALDSNHAPPGALDIQQVLDQRVEIRVAKVALEEARAKAKLEDVSARPDLSILYGLKRTQLQDTPPGTGTNTVMAGAQITIPVTDRNQGNRDAAAAEVRRQQQSLNEMEAAIRSDYFGALQDYQLRQHEVTETLEPLREHGATIADIAQKAYQQGGTDLLRLLDAERARLDAQLAWVRGMVEYQQSFVALETAEGVSQ